MTPTPEDQAGWWTEEIMAGWVRRMEDRKEPHPTTAVYNAAYEAVYAWLSAHVRSRQCAVRTGGERGR